MTIGIDLSSLQGAHRMRGIGYTLLNFINNIAEADRKKHRFVFYVYPSEQGQDPLDILNLKGLDYEVRGLGHRQRINKKLPGRLNLFVSALNQLSELKDLHFGDSRITDLSGVDFYLQTDQSQHLPRKFGVKKGLIIYDIIPYVLEWEYMWSYRTARRRGFSRKAALRVGVRRWLYAYKIKVNTKRADVLFSISEHTKQDFTSCLGTREDKIVVTPLGINLPSKDPREDIDLKRYVKTSWGYIRREFQFEPEARFILYVGGGDKRRKLEDLVAAFNMLRAQGMDLKLVLAGDCMQGPNNIATEEIQHALKTSSYKDDIIYMGFVDDQTRDWLYGHALAFVFPSRYEGFGLPVLEAMSYGTPVISYQNSSTKEVAGNSPMYVDSYLEIYDAVIRLLKVTPKELESLKNTSRACAAKYSWQKTASQVLAVIANKN